MTLGGRARKKDVPDELQELADDELSGLIGVDLDHPDGTIVYESCRRVGGRAAIEIPHEEGVLVDEPETSFTPPDFDEWVLSHGCAAVRKEGFTYIVVPDGDSDA
jgi:hypothetical protein